MAFQIKSFAGIGAGMINWLKSVTTKVTDFNVGSVVRTMLEAVAQEIEELYLQLMIGLREAIPVSVYNTFGFDALPAAAASGTLRFSVGAAATAQIPIPVGSSARVPGGSITYATTADAYIDIGNTYVDVPCSASTTGASTNVGANLITEFVLSVPGVSAVTNPVPLSNGRDVESDDARLSRFRAYIQSLARGTIYAVLYGAETATRTDSSGNVVEYVKSASLDEPWIANPSTYPIGLVNVYVHNGGSSTTAQLVANAQKIINGYYEDDGTPVPGWKAAGVKVVVYAATDVPVNVTGTITVAAGYVSADVVAASRSAVQLYIQGLSAGAKVLLSELISIIKRDVDGVTNVVLSAPSGDVSITAAQKAIPGTVTLTAA